ncbi:MAG: hypothetical protein ACFBZ8_05020 [Opitutales bacterium]
MTTPTTVTTAAVVDLGSNTIKLLVASVHQGQLTEHLSRTLETRISTGIGRSRRPEIDQATQERAATAVKELLAAAAPFHPEKVAIVATSAVRGAANAGEFAKFMHAQTGHPLRVLSGEAEAAGVARGISTDPALQDSDRFHLIDLGGGSLEIVRHQAGRIERGLSLEVGAVRMTERHCLHPEAPIPQAAFDAIVNDLDQQLAHSGFVFEQPFGRLIGTGGGVTITRAILAREHGMEIDHVPAAIALKDLERIRDALASVDLSTRIERFGLPANRADILPAALAILTRLTELAGTEALTHSFRNLRFGIVADLLEL